MSGPDAIVVKPLRSACSLMRKIHPIEFAGGHVARAPNCAGPQRRPVIARPAARRRPGVRARHADIIIAKERIVGPGRSMRHLAAMPPHGRWSVTAESVQHPSWSLMARWRARERHTECPRSGTSMDTSWVGCRTGDDRFSPNSIWTHRTGVEDQRLARIVEAYLSGDGTRTSGRSLDPGTGGRPDFVSTPT
jgi:hypothetical protein